MFDYRGISTRDYQAVGEIAIASASIDHGLESVMAEFLKGKSGEVIASGLPYSQIEQSLRALIKHDCLDDSSGTLVRILDEARDLHKKRDAVIHGIWIPVNIENYILKSEPPDSHYVLKSKRWTPGLSGETYTSDDLESLAIELHSLSQRVAQFVRDLTQDT